MKIHYFTDTFLARLRRAVPQNIEKYLSGDEWIEAFAEGPISRETSIEVPSLRPLQLPSAGNKFDAENSQIIYSDLKHLDPTQAADERLWAYLAHTHYREYMVARWGHPKPSVIVDRFFFRHKGMGSLVRNGIARLWWFGHLTYKEDRADRFELTKILLSNQDIQNGLLQREVGKNPTIRSATLEYFHNRREAIEDVGRDRGGQSRVVQHLLVGLNLAGGVYLLDALPPETLHSILDDSLSEFHA